MTSIVRLDTQFDESRAGAVAATPTCGGCCCCCCCIVAMVGTTALSGSYAARQEHSTPGAVVLACAAFPIAFLVALVSFGGGRDATSGVFVAGLGWIGLLAIAYRMAAGAWKPGIVMLTVVLGTAAFAVEFAAGLMVLLSGAFIAYPLFALVGSVAVIVHAVRRGSR